MNKHSSSGDQVMSCFAKNYLTLKWQSSISRYPTFKRLPNPSLNSITKERSEDLKSHHSAQHIDSRASRFTLTNRSDFPTIFEISCISLWIVVPMSSFAHLYIYEHVQMCTISLCICVCVCVCLDATLPLFWQQCKEPSKSHLISLLPFLPFPFSCV